MRALTRAILFGAVACACIATLAPAEEVDLLNPYTHPKFVNPLPIAARWDLTAGGSIQIGISQVQQYLGLVDPMTNAPLATTVWGYNGTYPGPTLVVRSGVPLDVLWTNDLLGPGGPLPHLLPVDETLHWAMPENYPYSGVPVVTHVHGGHSESASDGLPDAWFTPGFAQTGGGFVKQTLHYDNDQEAGTIWYHDHALGITRLNVYAGLAGFYLIRDANEDALVAANQLPTGPYEIEMAIQDRMFTTDGELYYPSEPEEEGQPEPSHLPEFFGDFILVNSAPWPILEVEPRQYRFRMLNGSDSRFYDLWLQEKIGDSMMQPKAPVPSMYQIGTDTGLLNAPVPLTRFVIGTGERADMVIDFSDPIFWDKTYILRNSAKTPFPKGSAVNPQTTGQVMAFRVSKPLDTSVYPPTTLPANLRPLHGPVGMPVPNASARDLILFEGEDEYGRLMAKLGTLAGALAWDAPITENIMLNDTEVWEVYNTTADAHPIHLHLVSFRILDRQKFKAHVDPVTGAVSNVRLIGTATSPPAREQGWKDTAVMFPGEVTRVVAKFDREGLYVWHCHILSHEDHEMMRPYMVSPALIAANAMPDRSLRLEAAYPNPFNPSTRVRFELAQPSRVDAAVYDVAGRLVRRFDAREYAKGRHVLTWDGATGSGAPAATGVYFLRVQAGNTVATRRLVMIK